MELENSEFAKALEEAVGRFFELDTACERVKEKGICDVVGVKCDSSCKIYVRKEKWLNTLIEFIKADQGLPSAITQPVSEPSVVPAEPERPKERLCPSCGMKAARPESKYCDYCGEELG